MKGEPLPAERLVPGLRSLIVRSLVERRGMRKRDAARALGLSPSAVTQYLKGGRASSQAKALSKPEIVQLVDDLSDKIALRGGNLMQAEFFELLYTVSGLLQRSPQFTHEAGPIDHRGRERLLSTLRGRLQAEQEAAELFMGVAVGTRDDLTRLLFRGVASDSIRHADIVMTIISSIEKGEAVEPDIPDKGHLQKLLAYEESAHVHNLDAVKPFFPSEIISALLASIEADERKHSDLLKRLMAA
ncbi:MAG TPA: helix-turn-helix domain-containing protein [Conexivisphaerales archaeon]|nr:helix-turn-helix domain-containing protein [Conexivisphaerales archaeon]